MTLWGGRFEGRMSEITARYTFDDSDRRLLAVDIEGSIAHARMLGEAGIIEREESETLVEGLEKIGAETFVFHDDDEDVHTAVERRLRELVGDVAGKLHTARSRNDQVALDLRLYLVRAGAGRARQLRDLALLLADLAEDHLETVIPAYTHLQQAQPGTLGHHLSAYAWMMLRDAERLDQSLTRIGISPLGAGASSGSSLPIDRSVTARALGMEQVMPNSMDAVGSRDFVSEYVFCCAQAMIDLSRLAEEIVLWATSEFGWVVLSDEVSTGSSALPQKRNPDIAELARGRAAGLVGDVAAVLTLQKGLALTYNRDLQEDKRVVFHADDTLAGTVDAMGALLAGVTFVPPLPGPNTTALDMAERLVGRGTPFREAHELVGRLVRHLEGDGRTLAGATTADLSSVDDRFEPSDLEVVDPEVSVRSRVTDGSPSPTSVLAQIQEIRRLAQGGAASD